MINNNNRIHYKSRPYFDGDNDRNTDILTSVADASNENDDNFICDSGNVFGERIVAINIGDGKLIKSSDDFDGDASWLAEEYNIWFDEKGMKHADSDIWSSDFEESTCQDIETTNNKNCVNSRRLLQIQNNCDLLIDKYNRIMSWLSRSRSFAKKTKIHRCVILTSDLTDAKNQQDYCDLTVDGANGGYDNDGVMRVETKRKQYTDLAVAIVATILLLIKILPI